MLCLLFSLLCLFCFYLHCYACFLLCILWTCGKSWIANLGAINFSASRIFCNVKIRDFWKPYQRELEFIGFLYLGTIDSYYRQSPRNNSLIPIANFYPFGRKPRTREWWQWLNSFFRRWICYRSVWVLFCCETRYACCSRMKFRKWWFHVYEILLLTQQTNVASQCSKYLLGRAPCSLVS